MKKQVETNSFQAAMASMAAGGAWVPLSLMVYPPPVNEQEGYTVSWAADNLVAAIQEAVKVFPYDEDRGSPSSPELTLWKNYDNYETGTLGGWVLRWCSAHDTIIEISCQDGRTFVVTIERPNDEPPENYGWYEPHDTLETRSWAVEAVQQATQKGINVLDALVAAVGERYSNLPKWAEELWPTGTTN